jgi:predicted anti-sigma-YlaC factor YlaD
MNDGFESRIGAPHPADRCGWVRDLLPLRGSGIADVQLAAELDEHLADCAECRAEAEFVDRLRRARPEPPAGLVEATLERYVERPRVSARKLRWGGPFGVSAAVVAALGFGLFALSESANDPLWGLALDPEPTAWYGEEWIVAGGPVPEALSDDQLLLLLEEMDP